MLSKEDKQVLLKELAAHRKEIAELRVELNKLNELKESAFEKKRKYAEEIRSIISDIRKNRSSRDKITKEVKVSKEQRQKINDKIKEQIKEVRKLKTKKRELIEKHNLKGDPTTIKREINKLEFKMETNIMPFDAEKKLMKVIKEKRKQLNEFKAMGDVWSQIKEISNKISDLKRKADAQHANLTSKAANSQQRHSAVVESSKKLDELRANEKKYAKEFMKYKAQFTKLNTSFKEKLKEMAEISKKLESSKNEERKEKKKKQEEIIKSKKEDVKEKIKKGKKLTTEDLLVFQGMED